MNKFASLISNIIDFVAACNAMRDQVAHELTSAKQQELISEIAAMVSDTEITKENDDM